MDSSVTFNPYICTPSSLPDADRECMPFEAEGSDSYYNSKFAQYKFMEIIARHPSSSPAMQFEAKVIAWLIGREIGYSLYPDESMESDLQILLPQFSSATSIRDLYKASGVKVRDIEIEGMIKRVKFWQAKLALILISDIDNPQSRHFLELTFAGSSKSVFGVTIDPSIKDFSAADRMRLLKQVYKKLIAPYGDPLLEAECLLSQHELRVNNPDMDPELQPSEDLAYARGKLTEVARKESDIRTADRVYEARRKQRRSLTSDEERRWIPGYIYDRVPDQGYNLNTNDPYWKGTPMRIREAYRYLAQTKRMQGQLILLETRYNTPDFADKMEAALKLVTESQTLVDKYGDEPAKIRSIIREHRSDARVPTNRHSRSYGDFLTLLSSEEMKASIHYRLGIHFMYTNGARSRQEFQAAHDLTKKTPAIFDSVGAVYDEKFQFPRVLATDILSHNFLLRSLLLGSNLLLTAGIGLANNADQRAHVLQAIALLESSQVSTTSSLLSSHQARGEAAIWLRLNLVDALLRRKPADTAEDEASVYDSARLLAPLFDPTYDTVERSVAAATAPELFVETIDKNELRRQVNLPWSEIEHLFINPKAKNLTFKPGALEEIEKLRQPELAKRYIEMNQRRLKELPPPTGKEKALLKLGELFKSTRKLDDIFTDPDAEHLRFRQDIDVEAAIRTQVTDAAQQEALIALYHGTLDPEAEQALAILATRSEVADLPHAQKLSGSIRLAQAKVLLFRFYLTEAEVDRPFLTNPSAPTGALEILSALIEKARPTDDDFKPTPAGDPVTRQPNNGVFEDYALSSALQLRAEVQASLRNYDKPLLDLKRALSVFQDKDGKPLNLFAEFSLAGFLQSVASDQAAATIVMTAAARDWPELKLGLPAGIEIADEARGTTIELTFLLKAEERLLALKKRLDGTFAPQHDALKNSLKILLASVQSRVINLYRVLVGKIPPLEEKVLTLITPPEVQATIRRELAEAETNLRIIQVILSESSPLKRMTLAEFITYVSEQFSDTGDIQNDLYSVLEDEAEQTVVTTEAGLQMVQNTGIELAKLEDQKLLLAEEIDNVLVPQAHFIGRQDVLEALAKKFEAYPEYAEYAAKLRAAPPAPAAYGASLVKPGIGVRGTKALADSVKNIGSLMRDIAGYIDLSGTDERDSRLSDRILDQAVTIYQEADTAASELLQPGGQELSEEIEMALIDIPTIKAGRFLKPAKEKEAIVTAATKMEARLDTSLDTDDDDNTKSPLTKAKDKFAELARLAKEDPEKLLEGVSVSRFEIIAAFGPDDISWHQFFVDPHADLLVFKADEKGKPSMFDQITAQVADLSKRRSLLATLAGIRHVENEKREEIDALITALVGSYHGKLKGRSRIQFIMQLAGYYMRQGFIDRQLEGQTSINGNAMLNLARHLFIFVLKTKRGELALAAQSNLALIRFVEAADKMQRFFAPDGQLRVISTFWQGKFEPLHLRRELEILWDDLLAKEMPAVQGSLRYTGRAKIEAKLKLAQLYARYGQVAMVMFGKTDKKAADTIRWAREITAEVKDSKIKELELSAEIVEISIDLALASVTNNDDIQELVNIRAAKDRLLEIVHNPNLTSRDRIEVKLLLIQARTLEGFLISTYYTSGTKDVRESIFSAVAPSLASRRELVKEKQEILAKKEAERSAEDITRLSQIEDELVICRRAVETVALPTLKKVLAEIEGNREEEANLLMGQALVSLMEDIFFSGRQDFEAAGDFWVGQIFNVIGGDNKDMLFTALEHLETAVASGELRGENLLRSQLTAAKIMGRVTGISQFNIIPESWDTISSTYWGAVAMGRFEAFVETLEKHPDLPLEWQKFIAEGVFEMAELNKWQLQNPGKALALYRKVITVLTSLIGQLSEADLVLEAYYAKIIASAYIGIGDILSQSSAVGRQDLPAAEIAYLTAFRWLDMESQDVEAGAEINLVVDEVITAATAAQDPLDSFLRLFDIRGTVKYQEFFREKVYDSTKPDAAFSKQPLTESERFILVRLCLGLSMLYGPHTWDGGQNIEKTKFFMALAKDTLATIHNRDNIEYIQLDEQVTQTQQTLARTLAPSATMPYEQTTQLYTYPHSIPDFRLAVGLPYNFGGIPVRFGIEFEASDMHANARVSAAARFFEERTGTLDVSARVDVAGSVGATAVYSYQDLLTLIASYDHYAVRDPQLNYDRRYFHTAYMAVNIRPFPLIREGLQAAEIPGFAEFDSFIGRELSGVTTGISAILYSERVPNQATNDNPTDTLDRYKLVPYFDLGWRRSFARGFIDVTLLYRHPLPVNPAIFSRDGQRMLTPYEVENPDETRRYNPRMLEAGFTIRNPWRDKFRTGPVQWLPSINCLGRF
ncbi:MAG: hypothetical protein ABIE84_07340, partial [bacterium]